MPRRCGSSCSSRAPTSNSSRVGSPPTARGSDRGGKAARARRHPRRRGDAGAQKRPSKAEAAATARAARAAALKRRAPPTHPVRGSDSSTSRSARWREGRRSTGGDTRGGAALRQLQHWPIRLRRRRRRRRLEEGGAGGGGGGGGLLVAALLAAPRGASRPTSVRARTGSGCGHASATLRRARCKRTRGASTGG